MKNQELINIIRYVKQVLKPYYHALVRMMKWQRRIGLHCEDFSIISNNCTGGYVYQYYGISYKTPTEGVYFTTDDYLKLIAALKKETFDIDVRFGLEVCYTPETESLLSSILEHYQFDFLVGSVHSVNGYLYDMDAFSKELLWDKNDPSTIYKSYYDSIEKLIQSNLFDQVGHPDVIKLYSIDPGYDLHPTYHHIARLANEYNIKMEDNTKAHYSYHHPDIGLNADFRNILKENNVQIVTASDAHYPSDVGRCFELLDPR